MFYRGAADTGGITLEPCKVATRVDVEVVRLGGVTNVDGNIE